MEAHGMSISTDADLTPALASEVGGLRGLIADTALEQPMPDRFTAKPHADRPAMIVTDSETGRSTTVGLYAYRAVRESLQDLFG